jgi:DNA invertase Pin-like site-specific DNA recombinase
MEAKKITIIPKKEKEIINLETGTKIKRKVCAYARVSTDLEDQKNSFNAQLEEYESRISKNPDWEFVGLYSDEGISGTSIKKREGFKKMVDDAIAGKIDLILVKSISRFARNTVDCLKTLRDLRARNIEVFFDKENISTNDPKVDIMLTIFASFAQEESKSISENVKWGVRKRMIKGQRKMPTKTLIGYKTNEDGSISVIEDEKELIKDIFNKYICGDTFTTIANYLNKKGLTTKTNKPFTTADIFRMFRNEKYCGDLVLQKTVVVDFLEHRAVQNDGIVDKVHIQNHHEPIISREQFIYLQALKKYRYENFRDIDNGNVNTLNGLIYCEDCLRTLKKIKQHPGTDYERAVLTCKQDKKTSIDYKECGCTSTLDYELALEASKVVFKKYYKGPDHYDQRILDAFINGERWNSYSAKVGETNKQIELLEIKLKEVLKKQLECDDFTEYSVEFANIKKEIAEKKALLKQYENTEVQAYLDYQTETKIKDWLEKNEIAPSLIKEVIKAVIYRKDKSLRFILSDTPINIFRESCDNYCKIEPIFKEKVTLKKHELEFDVIDMRGDQNEN